MTAQFEAWRAALQEMPKLAEAVTDGLTDDQFNWHPAKDRWSVAQCLDHLNRANGKILGKLEEGVLIANSRGPAPAGPWRPGFLERFFIRIVGANAPWKSPVPPDFVPGEHASRDEVLPLFTQHHERYVACLDEVDRAGLMRLKVPSAVTPLIKVSLGTWFAATVEHDSYHLGQAEQVRKELESQ